MGKLDLRWVHLPPSWCVRYELVYTPASPPRSLGPSSGSLVLPPLRSFLPSFLPLSTELLLRRGGISVLFLPSSLARSPFPGWGKRGSADPSTTLARSTSTSDPTCPETERRAPETPPRLVPTRERAKEGGSQGERLRRAEESAASAVGLSGGIAVVGVGVPSVRGTHTLTMLSSAAAAAAASRDPLARGMAYYWHIGKIGRN